MLCKETFSLQTEQLWAGVGDHLGICDGSSSLCSSLLGSWNQRVLSTSLTAGLPVQALGMVIPAAVPGCWSPVTLGTEKLLVWLWEASNEKCVGRTVLRVGWFAKPFTGQEQEL